MLDFASLYSVVLQHRNPDAPSVKAALKAVAQKLWKRPVSEGFSTVVAKRDRLQGFLNNTKRRFKRLKEVIVNENVEKKAFRTTIITRNRNQGL